MHPISDRIAFHIILGLCCLAACVPDSRSQGLRITDADFPIEMSLAKPAHPSTVAVSQGVPIVSSLASNTSLNVAVRS
jgi:hypothetical protein